MKLDQLDLDSVEAVVDEKVEDKVMLSSSFHPFPEFFSSVFFGTAHCTLRFPKRSMMSGFHTKYSLYEV